MGELFGGSVMRNRIIEDYPELFIHEQHKDGPLRATLKCKRCSNVMSFEIEKDPSLVLRGQVYYRLTEEADIQGDGRSQKVYLPCSECEYPIYCESF